MQKIRSKYEKLWLTKKKENKELKSVITNCPFTFLFDIRIRIRNHIDTRSLAKGVDTTLVDTIYMSPNVRVQLPHLPQYIEALEKIFCQ